MNVSIIIPNFNGKELLERNLPALFRALENFTGSYEVIVVDDGSSDKSLDFLKSVSNRVRTLALGENQGFARACNTGVRQSKYEIVLLLNNDVEVTPGFLQPLLEHFSEKDVFAVSSAEKSGGAYSAALVKFKFGIFWYWYQLLPAELNTSFDIFVASGGHTAFDKQKFLALNGFDPLFSPFYAEDGDICWRAWKRGWRSIFEPRSAVIHACKGTIGRLYQDRSIKSIHWKNRILMTWKNLDSFYFIARHVLFILPEFFLMPLLGKKEFSLGLLSALKQWPQLLSSRKRDRTEFTIFSDSNLFSRFSRLPRFPAGILYLHETSEFSGAENSLLNLAVKLDKIKFTPIFALPEPGPFAAKLKERGFDLTFISFPRIFSFFGFFRSIKAVVRLVKENDVRIIHSNSIRTHLYAFLAGRFCGAGVVWHERNLITDEIIDPERALYFLPDKILCNSYAIACRFLKNGKLPGNVQVAFNGVDTGLFNDGVSGQALRNELGIKPDEIVVAMTSRLNPAKGQETFLQAASILISGKSGLKDKLRFLIVGAPVFAADGPRERELKALARELGLSEKVIFAGFRQDMPQVYAAIDIFVLAAYAEPCGRVVLEAMSSGKPVVASDSGGTPEIIDDGESGFLFRPKDARGLAEKIAFLADNPDFAKKMGREARKRIEENFSIQRNVKQIQDVYLELLGRA